VKDGIIEWAEGSIFIYNSHETFKPLRDLTPLSRAPKNIKLKHERSQNLCNLSMIIIHSIPMYTYCNVQYHAKAVLSPAMRRLNHGVILHHVQGS